MIRRAGGDNVVTSGGGYPTLDVERVLQDDPDVVVNAAMAGHGIEHLGADTPGWSRLRAVVQGHVVALADESVLRPGPRVVDGLATLARALHPEAKVP
jgi:iron complex transport system substrate-binding protein